MTGIFNKMNQKRLLRKLEEYFLGTDIKRDYENFLSEYILDPEKLMLKLRETKRERRKERVWRQFIPNILTIGGALATYFLLKNGYKGEYLNFSIEMILSGEIIRYFSWINSLDRRLVQERDMRIRQNLEEVEKHRRRLEKIFGDSEENPFEFI